VHHFSLQVDPGLYHPCGGRLCQSLHADRRSCNSTSTRLLGNKYRSSTFSLWNRDFDALSTVAGISESEQPLRQVYRLLSVIRSHTAGPHILGLPPIWGVAFLFLQKARESRCHILELLQVTSAKYLLPSNDTRLSSFLPRSPSLRNGSHSNASGTPVQAAYEIGSAVIATSVGQQYCRCGVAVAPQ